MSTATRIRILLVLALALGLLPLLPAAAEETEPPACTVHWTGAAGTAHWEDEANWDVGYPMANDVVCIAGPLGEEVVLGIDASAEVAELHSTGRLVVAAGTLRVTGTADVAELVLTGGTLQVDSTFGADSARQTGGTLAGAGLVAVGGEYRWGGGEMVDAAGMTWADTLVLEGGADRALRGRVLDTRTTRVASAEPLLMLDDAFLYADEDLLVDGVDAGVAGGAGTVTATRTQVRNGGWLAVNARFESPEEGSVDVDASSNLTLHAGGTLAGAVRVAGTLDVAGGQVGFATTSAVAVTGTLGTFGGGSLAVESNASLGNVANDGELLIDAEVSSTTIVNHGDIEVFDGRGLAVLGDAGLVNEAGGLLQLDGPDALVGAAHGDIRNLAGGTIRGRGRFIGPVVNEGTVTLHDELAVMGPFTQVGGATLEVGFAGDRAGRLVADETVALDGTLALDLSEATITSTVAVVEAPAITGEFAIISGLTECTDVRYRDGAVTVDASACVAVDAGSAREDDELIDFTIHLPGGIDEDVMVTGTPHAGTATPGTDYEPEPVQLLVEAGTTQTVLSLPLIDDDEAEPQESFTLEIDAGPLPILTPVVTGTITDDDDPRYELVFPVQPFPGDDDVIVDVGGGFAVGRTTSGGTTTGWVHRYAAGEVTSLGTMVPEAVNEDGLIVGRCTAGLCALAADEQTPTPVPGNGRFAAANDRGVLVGVSGTGQPHAARWASPASSPELLPDLGGLRSFATDVNDQGVVVGYSDHAISDVDAPSSAWLWTEEDGVVEIVPPLGFPQDVEAHGINDDNVIVGFGTDDDEVRAWSWSPAGGFVDLGPGMAWAIGDDGVVYGAGLLGAVFWDDGEQVLLEDLVEGGIEPGTTLHNVYRVDANGVLVVDLLSGFETRLALLVPEGAGCELCIETSVEEARYPTPDAWAESDGEVTAGSPVRLAAQVRNRTGEPQTVEVQFELDGEPFGEPRSVTLGPLANTVVHAELDTDDLAWDGERPAPDHVIGAGIYDDEGELDFEDLYLDVDPRPVVLVHGERSWPDEWDPWVVKLAQRNEGWAGVTVPAIDSFGTATIATHARTLAEAIEELRTARNAWDVDLVAHGRGGLVARHYLADLLPPSTDDDDPDVRNLIMLGTPNAGTPCAALVADPTLAELRPELVARFNETAEVPDGVRVSSVAGDRYDETCGTPDPGDGFVATGSATHTGGVLGFFPVRHELLTLAPDVLDDFAVPALRSALDEHDDEPEEPEDDGSEEDEEELAPASFSAAAVAAAEGGTPQLLSLTDETVAPGDTVEVELPIVPGDLDSMGAVAVVPGTVELAFVRDGAVVASSGTDGETVAGFRTVTVPSPQATGLWKVRLTNTGSEPVTTPVAVFSTGSATRLDVTAEQVPGTDRLAVKAELTGPRPAELPPVIVAAVHGGTDDDRAALELHHTGDGVYVGEADGFRLATYTVFVDVTAGDFYRASTAAVAFTFGLDGPGNDAPTALPATVSVASGTPVNIHLRGTDPEGSPLTYEIVSPPRHGSFGGGGEIVSYRSADGFQGTDSFTFRVHDGELSSVPATVTIEVGRVATSIEVVRPIPAVGTQGSTLDLVVQVLGPQGRVEAPVAVEFEFAGRTTADTTSFGMANTTLLLDVPPGEHVVTITVPGDAQHAGSSTTHRVTVERGAPPQPAFVEATYPEIREAGYPVRLWADAHDPDHDAVRFEFDMEDDGDVDAVVERPDGRFDLAVSAVVVYPEAYDGPARVRVTDLAGHVAEATTTVHVAPHRPLGAMRPVTADVGDRVVAEDVDDSGRFVLYRFNDDAVDGEPQPLRLLDRQTGTSQLVAADSGLPATGGVLSGDGRFVAYRNDAGRVLVFDSVAGTTEPVSGSSAAWPAGVADDGRWVLLVTAAVELTGGSPLPNCGDVGYVPCEQLVLVERVEDRLVQVTAGTPDGGPFNHIGVLADPLSGDGRYVAFNGARGPKVWDRETGVIDALDVGAVVDTEQVSISDDGRYLTFVSDVDGIVPGDGNRRTDVFWYDREAGRLELVSVAVDGGSGDEFSMWPRLGAGGTLVAFSGRAGNLVPGDGNEVVDVFVRDLATCTTRRVSVEPRDGIPGDGGLDAHVGSGFFVDLTDDREVLFNSGSPNLVPGDVDLGVTLFSLTGLDDLPGEPSGTCVPQEPEEEPEEAEEEPEPQPNPEPQPDPQPQPAPEPAPQPQPGGQAGDGDVCAEVPTGRFRDVGPGDVHRRNIECLAELGIATGGPGGRPATEYGPVLPVTRGQIASFVARTLVEAGVVLPTNPRDAFDDDDGDPHEPMIDAMAALGILDGVGPRRFDPSGSVSRVQMGSILARAHAVLTGGDPVDAPDAFRDDDGSVHEPNINLAAAAGLVRGVVPEGTYDPSGRVSRAQMASFLVALLRT